MLLKRWDTVEEEDCEPESIRNESSKMSAEVIDLNSIEVSTRPQLELSEQSVPQKVPVPVHVIESTGSLDSVDSEVEALEDGSAELNERNSIEASTRSQLELSEQSVPQTVPVPLNGSGSSSSLDSVDSVVEELEDGSTELSELRRVFQTLDEDRDNFICVADLRHFMSRLGFDVSKEEAEAMLETVSKSGDGKVTLEEFCTLYQQSFDNAEPLSEEAEELISDDENDSIHQAFRIFDKNGDGVITAKELQVVLLDLGRPEGKSLQCCERMIQGVDTDGNGQIDIHKFKQMMSRN